MTLDPLTLDVVAGAVVLLSATLFVAEAWSRRAQAVDRLWSLAFAAAIAASLATLADAFQPSWVARALGNAAQVAVLWFMWSGVRACGGRRPLVGVAVGAAAVAGLGVLAVGPAGDPWAAGGLMLVGVAVGALISGVAILRGPLRQFQSGIALAVLLLVMGTYTVFRFVLYITQGPYSDAFTTYAGSELTTLVVTLVLNGSAFSMVSLRVAQTTRSVLLRHHFDAATGARTPASFEPRALDALRDAEERGRQMCFVVVEPDDVTAIRLAFGGNYADEALALCGETVAMVVPPRGLIGIDAPHGARFEVLLRDMGAAEAEEWAAGLRTEFLHATFELPSSRVRVTVSIGLASSLDHGYDLATLRAAGQRAAREASEQGGNLTVTAGAGAGALAL
ncbi:GGDEF domain-containing protein [Georgenia faecalis]|uniref:GGDEF domain-containing protein n=1 Tax=Georgenia faecalis TaxID=2483799 RepID=A0ABV9D5Z2_9MICO|nr:GGDEF domain-containing protein [Georgenia faecalis]